MATETISETTEAAVQSVQAAGTASVAEAAAEGAEQAAQAARQAAEQAIATSATVAAAAEAEAAETIREHAEEESEQWQKLREIEGQIVELSSRLSTITRLEETLATMQENWTEFLSHSLPPSPISETSPQEAQEMPEAVIPAAEEEEDHPAADETELPRRKARFL